MTLVGVGIDDLDLACLDVDKAIDRLAGTGEKCAPGIGNDLPLRAQRLDVRRGERGGELSGARSLPRERLRVS